MDSSHKVDVGGLLAGSRQLMLVEDGCRSSRSKESSFPNRSQVRLEMRQADRMLVVEGTVDATLAGECDACLEDVELAIHVDVDERLDPAAAARRIRSERATS